LYSGITQQQVISHFDHAAAAAIEQRSIAATQEPSNLATTVLAQSLGTTALKGSATRLCTTLECAYLHILVEYRMVKANRSLDSSKSAPSQ